jgi:hypothetical protein
MVRTRDNKPDIIGITEVKNKNNRQNPSIAEYSIGEVGKYQMFAKNIDREEGKGILLFGSDTSYSNLQRSSPHIYIQLYIPCTSK